MARNANTTRSGWAFDQRTIDAVWAKARIVPGVDPAIEAERRERRVD